MNTKSHEYRKMQSELIKQGKKRCSRCAEIKPLGDFKGRSGRCKPCAAVKQREWSESEKGKAYYKDYQFDYAIRQHGIEPTEYYAMLEQQGGGCAACGTTDPGGRGRWQIDHDHSCCPKEKSCGSCIRGLLCWKCNYALGLANDDPDRLRKMIDYLEAAQ